MKYMMLIVEGIVKVEWLKNWRWFPDKLARVSITIINRHPVSICRGTTRMPSSRAAVVAAAVSDEINRLPVQTLESRLYTGNTADVTAC